MTSKFTEENALIGEIIPNIKNNNAPDPMANQMGTLTPLMFLIKIKA
jgi:hypothetical protein